MPSVSSNKKEDTNNYTTGTKYTYTSMYRSIYNNCIVCHIIVQNVLFESSQYQLGKLLNIINNTASTQLVFSKNTFGTALPISQWSRLIPTYMYTHHMYKLHNIDALHWQFQNSQTHFQLRWWWIIWTCSWHWQLQHTYLSGQDRGEEVSGGKRKADNSSALLVPTFDEHTPCCHTIDIIMSMMHMYDDSAYL